MTKFVAVCLSVLVCCSSAMAGPRPAQSFEVADYVGDGSVRSFFLFSTSAGKYVLRRDGMCEVTASTGMRRVFKLKLAPRSRLEHVFYLEHDGDLFLFYEGYDAGGTWSYLVRLDQTKRKNPQRWLAAVTTPGAPVIDGDMVLIGTVAIDKADGHVMTGDGKRVERF